MPREGDAIGDGTERGSTATPRQDLLSSSGSELIWTALRERPDTRDPSLGQALERTSARMPVCARPQGSMRTDLGQSWQQSGQRSLPMASGDQEISRSMARVLMVVIAPPTPAVVHEASRGNLHDDQVFEGRVRSQTSPGRGNDRVALARRGEGDRPVVVSGLIVVEVAFHSLSPNLDPGDTGPRRRRGLVGEKNASPTLIYRVSALIVLPNRA
jgi:hypothetical protein